MVRFTLFSSVASRTLAIGEAFAVPAVPSAASRAGRFRRGVAAGLLLTMLTPFAPAGHVHAEDDEYEVSDVPAIEAVAASSVNGAAAVHGCAPYITSSSPTRPLSGTLSSGFCAAVPIPWTTGIVTCQLCTCFYVLEGGGMVNLNEWDCGTIVVIQNPGGGGDDCTRENPC